MIEKGSDNPEMPGSAPYVHGQPIEKPASIGGESGEITSPAPPSEIAPESEQASKIVTPLPNVTEQPWATYVEGIGSQTGNFLFRKDNHNTGIVGTAIAPAIMAERPEGAVFKVLDAPSSRGADSWSLASILSVKGIEYHIDCVDANSLVIARAREPIAKARSNLVKNIAEWKGVPPKAADYFERVDPSHIRPNDELQSRVDFHHADLLQGVPTELTYDVALCNKVLMYYATKEGELTSAAHRMIGNIATKLHVGGLFTFSDTEWVRDRHATDAAFAQHGLVPAENRYAVPDEQWDKLIIYQKTEDSR
jgi:chemotaxis methyl-accepting protein methylase